MAEVDREIFNQFSSVVDKSVEIFMKQLPVSIDQIHLRDSILPVSLVTVLLYAIGLFEGVGKGVDGSTHKENELRFARSFLRSFHPSSFLPSFLPSSFLPPFLPSSLPSFLPYLLLCFRPFSLSSILASFLPPLILSLKESNTEWNYGEMEEEEWLIVYWPIDQFQQKKKNTYTTDDSINNNFN